MVEKACKVCRTIYEGAHCPACDSKESVSTFKGKIYIVNPEQSEIAGHIGIKKKGKFAVRLK